MPKFHCIHCGQRIAAPDSLSGTRGECPTCGGEIDVPGIQARKKVAKTKRPKSSTSKSDKKAWSFLGTILFIIVAVLLGRACGNLAGRHAAERDFANDQRTPDRSDTPKQRSNEESQVDAHDSFVPISAGGLSINVPKNLSKLNKERESGGDIELLEKYTAVWDTRSLLVKRFIFDDQISFSPSEAADLTEDDIKTQPGYRATREFVQVSGLDGIVLKAKYRGMGQAVEQSILYFSRGSEMWEIHIFGVNEKNLQSLDEMKEKVFSSVKIRN